MSSLRLPGGKGPRTGPDAVVNQNEALNQRRLDIPAQNGWVFSNFPNVLGADLSSAIVASGTANLASFYYVGTVDKMFELTTAKVVCTLGAASSTLQIGVYAYDSTTQSLKLVPSSLVTFDTTSAATLNMPISRAVILQPNQHYFIGQVCSSVTPTFTGTASLGFNRPISAISTLQLPSTNLPSTVKYGEIVKSQSAAAIWVTYLSTEATKLL